MLRAPQLHMVDFTLVSDRFYIVVERTGIRDIGVYAFFKFHPWIAAQVVALPVAGAA